MTTLEDMPTHTTAQSNNPPGPFFIKDCALVALATGKRARMLQEFRNELIDIGRIKYLSPLLGQFDARTI